MKNALVIANGHLRSFENAGIINEQEKCFSYAGQHAFFSWGDELAFMFIPVSELRTAHFVRNLTIASYVDDMHYEQFMNFELCCASRLLARRWH